ncbi:2-phospho-L-lactate guanylyltransferase [Nocardioides immobilis]|uniref:2-phospho-L-lactate guanylyltransferase n=1 Tax=Nocardioides immobilis TaxID=2049295 RepID=UPI0015FC29E8
MNGHPWRVVICARRLDVAKSRLRPLGEEARQGLALAMARDVLKAVGGAPGVSEVVLVSDDPSLAHLARAVGAVVLRDPGLGLNSAFLHGMGAGRSGDTWTAMLMADLPCLTSHVLQRVLDAAARHPAAVVADREGIGSTLLTTAPGCRARPRFGERSFHQHVATGATPVAADEPRARCDVDTQADLGVALGIGVGAITAHAVEDFGLDRVGLNKQL